MTLFFHARRLLRNHATLLRRTDLKTNQCSYWILDGDLQGNRSRNGIYVNGKKSLVHELHSGDVVHFSADASVKYKIISEAFHNSLEANYSPPHTIVPVAASSLALDNIGNNVVDRDALVNKETYVAAHPETTSKSDKPVKPYEQNSLAEFSPYPIFEIDLYGNITYINSAGIITFKDIHHRKLSHPLLKDLITQYHQGHDNIITREVTIDEQTFQQTAHYLPEKRIIRNYITDISYQKNIQIELQQLQSFSNLVVQQISEGVILVEPATKQIIEANAASAHLLGYSQDQLLQLNIYELVQDSEKLALVLRTMIDEKNGFEGEFVLRHKNSSLIKSLIQSSTIESGIEEKICLIIRNLSGSSSSDIPGQSTSEYKRNLYNQQLLTAIANAKRSQNFWRLWFVN